MNRHVLSVFFVCSLLASPVAMADQGEPELNPDISVVPDLRALMADATEHDLDLVIDQVEVGLQANLNPFARGDVFLRFNDGNVDVEEAYATFHALPGGLGLRAGQYRARIGRFNAQHSHRFAFLDYPLFVGEFFGDRGLSDVGVNPSLLLDFGVFPVTVSADVMSKLVDSSSTVAPPPTSSTQRRGADLVYNGRVSAFLTLQGGQSFIELGATAGTATLDVRTDLRATWFGFDGKFKWRPNNRTSFEAAGEFLAQRRKITGADADTPAGAFGYFNYQFAGRWNIGGLAEYTQLASMSDQNQKGYAGFLGYSLAQETTMVRLLVRNDDLPGSLGNLTGVQLQLVMGLGKHKTADF